jgi:predicted MPP superfamily phosphohydrolase
VNHIRLDGTALSEALHGKTAIHLSDFHLKKIGRREKKILEMIDEINPDFIFLTGDYVKWDGNYEVALNYLSKFKAKIGVWAVMGDYDYSNSRKSCLLCHEQGTGKPTERHSVYFLKNKFQKIGSDSEAPFIGGIEQEGNSDLPSIETPSIILSHSPLFFNEVDNESKILMLSGDTHGGQIPLPNWFWKLIGYEKTAKYSHGLYQKGNKILYVSRGIGTSHIPIRLFRPPEIVIIHF